MNGLDVNEHVMTKNYIAINDITCDIDSKDDIIRLREETKKMIKCEVIENFTLEKFNQLKNVNKVMSRKDNEFGARDTFECDKEMADYWKDGLDDALSYADSSEVDEIHVVNAYYPNVLFYTQYPADAPISLTLMGEIIKRISRTVNGAPSGDIRSLSFELPGSVGPVALAL